MFAICQRPLEDLGEEGADRLAWRQLRTAPQAIRNTVVDIAVLCLAIEGTLRSKKGYRIDLPDNRAAPTIPPSADSITTATSWPSGNRSLISRGLPDHSPIGRIDRTTLDSASVRPPFSPRPIFVVCSWSNPMRRTLPRPTPDPILIATFSIPAGGSESP
jgi:hypothetical protein